MVKKAIFLMLLACAMALALSGCLFQGTEELYALPKQSEEYYELQSEIELLLTDQTSYAAPTSGTNQQSVQLADLDGDAEDEAIVFLRTTGEKPLRAYIFDRIGEDFRNVAVIEGDGSSFASVEYVQIDGQPGLEMVLGRQISDQVPQALSVYALRENRVVELMSANYNEYTTVDLDRDGKMDIFLLRFSTEVRSGVAEYYRHTGSQIERAPESLLSTGVENVRRIITGYVDTGVPAVFVASMYDENSVVTDIFALRDGAFVNITAEGASGTSAQTVRNYYVYAADIDNDGLIELPQPKQLPQAETAAEDEAYWIIDWYHLSIDGQREKKLTTYHNYSGGWFLVLPEEWEDQLTITYDEAEQGMHGYTFHQWKGYGQETEPIFTIYALSGEDRKAVASSDGRFPLGDKGDVTYAASFGTSELADDLTQADLVGMFKYIQIDWNSGEV